MYYPLSQIITNLYTNGSEFSIAPDGNENTIYIGYYWKTSKGDFFTGRTPDDSPIVKLYPLALNPIKENNILPLAKDNISVNFLTEEIFPEDAIINDNLLTYVKISNFNNSKPQLPYYSITLPSDKDYQTGEFIRFFCKKANENNYIEIDKEYYNKLVKNDRSVTFEYYIPFNISWRLTGDKEQVYKVNKNVVELTMKQQKLPMFDLYIKKDYTKYYK